jgi:ribose 1,5-bisphosphokinase
VRAGHLIAVVGPSGAGKDSLIAGARQSLAENENIHFARRHVTRPHNAGGEDHIEISHDEFERKSAEGFFALHWQAHGLRYGISRRTADRIAEGVSVVANLSRRAVPDARVAFPRTRVVHVTAPPAVLAERLAGRSRESVDDIAARLARQAPDLACDDVHEIVNAGSLDDAIREFTELLTRFSRNS